jgi:hypothetical protein
MDQHGQEIMDRFSQNSAQNKRERMCRVDHQRRERRGNTIFEVAACFPLLVGRQFVPMPQENTALGKFRDDGPAVAVRLQVQQRKQLLTKPENLIFAVPKRGHSLHEELVQIRGEDSQKLHSLKKRRALVESFGENSLVKFEPAQVAIDPNLGKRLR